MRLAGRVAIVTGGATGIGAVASRRMADEGAAVVVADTDGTAAADVVSTVLAAGGRAVHVGTDVSSSASVQEMVAAAIVAYGRIDVLLNNAGVHESGFTDHTTALELPEEVFDRVLAVNLKGAWLASRAVAPHLAAVGGGAIVNAASMSARFGQPRASAYGPSKAAIVNLTQVLAQELAPAGTRVNCYAPGNVDTAMLRRYLDAVPVAERAEAHRHLTEWHLFPRLVTAGEVADVAIFLACDDSSGITGACIPVDLGAAAWRGRSSAVSLTEP